MDRAVFYEYIIVLLSVFALTAVLLRLIIPVLKSHKLGQPIKDIGPRWHKSKEGTPVMGGIGFIMATLIVLLIISIVSLIRGTIAELVPLALGLGLAVANGMIGFFDDYCKLLKKQNEGLKAYQKYLLQLVVAAVYLLFMSITGNLSTEFFIPFVKKTLTIDLFMEKLTWVNNEYLIKVFHYAFKIFYYAIALLLITGIVNSVNLTDGIDGLAASVTAVVGGFFAVRAFYIGRTNHAAGRSLSLLSSSVIGGTLGFLVYNWHPARVFMGDTGSLYLGGAVVGAAFMLNCPLVILVAGFVYVFEAISVILQVGVFKLSGRKKRLFKMAPFHHHLEKCGWKEVTIVCVFTLLTVGFCVAAWFSI